MSEPIDAVDGRLFDAARSGAAAAGHLDVVRRLADAGGDVVGRGDDHELAVIGWATCWDGCDDDAHRAIAELLVARGARHHVFSAIALGLAEEVRRIVAADPSALDRGADASGRWAHWDAEVTPLHLAAMHGHAGIARMLLAAGADPTIRDTKHDGDAMDWAAFFRQSEIVRILEEHAAGS